MSIKEPHRKTALGNTKTATLLQTVRRKEWKELLIMNRRSILLGFCLVALAASVAAQTVTGSGTTNRVPVFTGSSTVGNSPISVSGTSVGIGTTSPRSVLDVNAGNGVGNGLRLGSYWEFGNTAYMADAYFGVNAVLTTSSIPNGTNYFSPIWAAGEGMVMTQMGGGSGDITFYGINWNGSSSPQQFPQAFTPVLNLNYNGSVGIGTTNPARKLEIAGDVQIDGNLYFGSNQTPQSAAYSGSCGGDYAESMDVTGERTTYAPGDLLVLDPDNPGKILKSVEPYSTTVAGIYSTKPGPMGRRQTGPKSDSEVPMAMVGVVPAKVSAENGAIKIGDLLVSSSMAGYAMKGTDRSRLLGAVVGKAMGNLDSGTGVIEVLVTLQ